MARAGSSSDAPRSVRVLYVCTANRCRSPLAEHALRGTAGTLPLVVASAGLLAGGASTPAVGVATARRRGIDLAGHRSEPVRDLDLARFDLVLTMERVHSRELVASHDAARGRVFTVRQFDDWAPRHPSPPADRLGPWLDDVAVDDAGSRLFGGDADDTPDPLRGPPRAWRRLADELQAHAASLVAWLYPSPPGDPRPRSSAS
ncbi:low molecular weight phosphatase family protein [Microbacterium marinilacus]|uniref:protein-tyrosine-phosphatase n=1 Tax=Microbacterium marinilacus TaxID=415209 RepID=A0ABP7BNY4_9MICO|nr:hypothetical protein [Microbacterium marinilacus]MBY0690066.1 hypothetical protein [Microbacterium marinilacus]